MKTPMSPDEFAGVCEYGDDAYRALYSDYQRQQKVIENLDNYNEELKEQQAAERDRQQREIEELKQHDTVTCRYKINDQTALYQNEKLLHDRSKQQIADLRASVDHYRIKAECYGNIVHGCSPVLEAAGHPVDSRMPQGAVGGIKIAVESLVAERDDLRAQLAEAKAECDALRVEYESRAIWIERLCKTLGYDNSDGFHSSPDPFEMVQQLQQRVDALEGALRTVLADEESQEGGWGPDVTMVAVLKAALEEK